MGYEDVVKSGVRLKNQRSALFRSEGLEFILKDVFKTQTGDRNANWNNFVNGEVYT